MTDDEVMSTLSKLDKAATQSATTSAGPFSVFALPAAPRSPSAASYTCDETVEAGESSYTQETYKDFEEPGSSLEDDSLVFPSGSPSPVQEDAFQSFNTPLSTTFDALVEPSNLSAMPIADDIIFPEQDHMADPTHNFSHDLSSAAWSGQGNIEQNDRERNLFGLWNLLSSDLEKMASVPARHNDMPLQNSAPSKRLNPRAKVPSRVVECLPGNSGTMKFDYDLSTVLVDNTSAAMLMNHYTKHLVHLMQPISHQENPFRTIYLPLAVEGSSCLEVARSSDRTRPTSVAAFHSLLSTAAINLLDGRSDRGALRQLAWHHKQRALVALRSALASQSSKYKDLMTAILSLVSTDVSLLGFHAWASH